MGPSLYYVRVVQKMAIIMNYVMKISVRRGWVVLKSLKHPYVIERWSLIVEIKKIDSFEKLVIFSEMVKK